VVIVHFGETLVWFGGGTLVRLVGLFGDSLVVPCGVFCLAGLVGSKGCGYTGDGGHAAA